jgi:glucose/arabinose dehydrogenase
MKRFLCAAIPACAILPSLADKPSNKPLVTSLKNPESVAVASDGRVYVSVIGEPDKEGDGSVIVLDQGKAVPFATGMDDPKGVAAYQNWLFVADRQRVWRLDLKGNAEVFVAAAAFPTPPINLNDVTVDPESGTIYVSDSGDRQNKGGAVFRVDPNGKVTTLTDQKRWPELQRPNGVLLDGASHLLLMDSGAGALYRIRLGDGMREKLADGLGHADGLAWDRYGRLFLSDWRGGRVQVIGRPGSAPVLLADGFQSAADICLDPTDRFILVPDMKAGTVTPVPATVPGADVDMTPLPLETAPAFADLRWEGWKPETAAGVIVPLRPIVLTHAGDGSNQVFVATQHGVIHVFPNDPKAAQTRVFLDIQDRVIYTDAQNEEGFLGLAFHPEFKQNGEFFVFYTTKKAKMTNIVSRFRVSRDDPNRADPASEEEILRIANRPFWNHDGGTLCFGPDGYLYIAVGDGGAADDPFDNGQKLNTLFGKVLRIDVNRKEGDKNYAIPGDNPFAGRADARPEIWSYGLRNIWRMAFDRKTGKLWAGEVGQNLYEEIILVERGGNYGWNRREALHPFGPKGAGPRPEFIEPIWEYHHDIGKSITGGLVYRGTQLPELDGAYLYADYVSGRIWALRYDESAKRVVANRPIRDRSLPIMSFGEDERGEAYLMTYSASGQGLFRLVRSKESPKQ